MIRDSNLIAQYEGLNTLHIYLICASDQNVKGTTYSTLPDLLDKVNHKKHNFKEISIKIIETMFERELGHHITTELLKRFTNARNKEISEFSIQVLNFMIKKDLYMNQISHSLPHIFKGILHTLLDPKNKIRDAGLSLLKDVYMRIGDD